MTLRRFLNDKGMWVFTLIIYFVMLMGIRCLAYSDSNFSFLQSNAINEKEVNFFTVFFSNMCVIAKNIFLGLLSFGMYTLFVVIQNTVGLGLISNSLIHSHQSNLFFKMIPHGLIELFGIALSLSTVLCGIIATVGAIPKVVKREMLVKEILSKLKKRIVDVFKLEIVIFLIAAVVETLISRFKFLS